MAVPFGNMRFASVDEVRAHGPLTSDAGTMPLGFLIEDGKVTRHVVGNPLGQDAVPRGRSGSEKITTIFRSLALHAKGGRSVVLVDPKGEIHAVVRRKRGKC